MYYKVIFEDGSEFQCSIIESKWNEMSNKKIISIEYSFGGKKWLLEGFEAYNHAVAIVKGVNHPLKGITAFMVMGLDKGIVSRLFIDLVEGKIIKSELPFGFEFNNKPLTGWKEGVSGNSKLEEIV